jgi:hypothetical protein
VAYGDTQNDASSRLEVLALRVLADRIERGALLLDGDGIAFMVS